MMRWFLFVMTGVLMATISAGRSETGWTAEQTQLTNLSSDTTEAFSLANHPMPSSSSHLLSVPNADETPNGLDELQQLLGIRFFTIPSAPIDEYVKAEHRFQGDYLESSLAVMESTPQSRSGTSTSNTIAGQKDSSVVLALRVKF